MGGWVPASHDVAENGRPDIDVEVTFSNNEEMIAKLRATRGAGFDLAQPSQDRIASVQAKYNIYQPIDMSKVNGELLCQKDAFLCAALGTEISIAFNKRLGTGFFGGEGFIMQRLTGDGRAFVHAGGTVIKKKLNNETLRVDTGCLVALTQTVKYDIEYVGNVKSAVFGGEGFFFATLQGPGHVWLQSMPFSRLAGRIWSALPQGGGKSVGEGSVLGNLATLFEKK